MNFSKILTISILAFFIGYACKGSKNNKETSDKGAYKMADQSSSTRKFVKELETELNQRKDNDSLFVPSEEFINKYKLREDAGVYYVHGMIRTESGFDFEKFRYWGINVFTKAGNIYTVSIPITLVTQLVHQRGINYIQIDEPIRLR